MLTIFTVTKNGVVRFYRPTTTRDSDILAQAIVEVSPFTPVFRVNASGGIAEYTVDEWADVDVDA